VLVPTLVEMTLLFECLVMLDLPQTAVGRLCGGRLSPACHLVLVLHLLLKKDGHQQA
jgi:hypothetical protein